MDADIVADLHTIHTEPFYEMLHNKFYLIRETVEEAVTRRTSFNLIHLDTMFKVDVFLSTPSAFIRSQLERRLDYKYMKEMAEKTDVGDLLIRALKQSR